jgi:hypothetical protein
MLPIILFIAKVKVTVIAILKYVRVRRTCNALTISSSKITVKNTIDFLDQLKSVNLIRILKRSLQLKPLQY